MKHQEQSFLDHSLHRLHNDEIWNKNRQQRVRDRFISQMDQKGSKFTNGLLHWLKKSVPALALLMIVAISASLYFSENAEQHFVDNKQDSGNNHHDDNMLGTSDKQDDDQEDDKKDIEKKGLEAIPDRDSQTKEHFLQLPTDVQTRLVNNDQMETYIDDAEYQEEMFNENVYAEDVQENIDTFDSAESDHTIESDYSTFDTEFYSLKDFVNTYADYFVNKKYEKPKEPDEVNPNWSEHMKNGHTLKSIAYINYYKPVLNEGNQKDLFDDVKEKAIEYQTEKNEDNMEQLREAFKQLGQEDEFDTKFEYRTGYFDIHPGIE